MLDIQLVQKVKVIFGPGKVSEVSEILKTEGHEKAFLVCDKGVKAAGIVDKIIDSLEKENIEYIMFDQVVPDPPSEVIELGSKLCNDNKCDVVIAVGGGSSIDTGKGINLLRFNEGPILRFCDFSTPMNLSKGLISIPTTSGTGSELSDGIVVTDENHNKNPILALNAMSEYAIIDPELMVGMPPHLTASTGIDTLTHVIESYTSNVANLITDTIVEKCIVNVVKWLPIAVEDGKNIEARSNMAVACSIGGWMLGYGHTHAGHSIAHILGAAFNIPHGFACAYALPEILEFNAVVLPEKTQRVAEILGATFKGDETPEEIGAIAKEAARVFRDEKVKLQPATNFKYDESKFEEVAEKITTEMFQVFNPRKMEVEDALKIVKSIFK